MLTVVWLPSRGWTARLLKLILHQLEKR
jgi:hypothetical protein